MPMAIAAEVALAVGAATAGSIIATTIALVVTYAAVSLAISYAMSAVMGAFAKKPKTPGAATFQSKAQARTQTIRSAIANRRVILGEVRIGGTLTFYEYTGSRYHHLIVTVCDGPIQGFPVVWFNDVPIFADQIDGDGNVIAGKYSGKARIKKHLGATDQAADPDLVSETSVDANCRGRGVAYLYVRIDWDRDTYPNGLPNITAWAQGAKPYDTRDTTNRWSPNAALGIRYYTTELDWGVGADSSDLNDITFQAMANLCDEIVATVEREFTVSSVDTDDDEIAFSGERLELQTGDRVEVSSTDSVPTGLSTSTSYYVIVAKAWVTPTIQLASSYANALAGTAIDLTGEGSGTITVTKTGEPRYTANGVIDSDDTPQGILSDLLTALAGTLVNTGGSWKLSGGAYTAPTVELDEDALADSLKISTKHSRATLFNAVKGTYVSPVNDGQPADYPVVTSATYEGQDGKRIWTDLDMSFTSRGSTCQRLAQIYLLSHRQQKTVHATFNMQGLRLDAGGTAGITNARRSWTNKAFLVADWKPEVREDENGVPYVVFPTVLQETAPAVYGWTSATDESAVGTPGGTNPLDATDVGNPTSLSVESGDDVLDIRYDGTVFSRIKASWTAPTDAFVNPNGRIEVQFKKTSDDAWRLAGTEGGDATAAYILDVQDGVDYDVRIRSINELSVRASSWVTVYAHTVEGKGADPDPVDTFTVTRLADGTRRFAWTQATVAADVRTGGGHRIYWYSGTTSDLNDMTPLHTGLKRTSPFESNELAAGTYTFALTVVDSSGNESTPKFIQATLGDPRLRSVLAQQLEHDLGWPGTKTDCFVDYDGSLRATSDGTWADLPSTFSALPDTWDEILPNNSPITYETEAIDLGDDISFTPLITAEGTGAITIEARFSGDGSPLSWSAYAAPDAQSAKRFAQIKVTVSGTAPALETLTILFDGETQLYDYDDVDTSSETAVWFSSIAAGHFKIGSRGNMSSISYASIRAIQNVGPGWTPVLISKSETVDGKPAAEFKVYDGTGALADATVDIELKGPKSA